MMDREIGGEGRVGVGRMMDKRMKDGVIRILYERMEEGVSQ